MIEASCHCGLVALEIDEAPSEVTECNCSICRRYGVIWAYYAPGRVKVRSTRPTDTYEWDDRAITFHRCPECGCVSHWSPNNAVHDRMGVNARLMPPEVLAGARVRHLDGAGTEDYVD